MAKRATQLTAIQSGVESVWGTSVAQTNVLPNIQEFTIQPEVTISRYDNIGDLAEGTSHDVTEVFAGASHTERASYGLLPYWLENLFGDATTAGSSPYTHTHDVDSTAAPTRAGYTICKSDGTDAISLVGGLIQELKVTATPGELVELAITWLGSNAADGTLTAAQSNFTDADQLLKPSEVTVYIDPLGSAGSTALNCDALSFVLTITAITTLRNGLGTIQACDFATTGYDVKLELSADASNATVKTYIESLLGTSPTATQVDVELTFTKSASYAWDIICPMVLESAPQWHTDDDGVLTFDLNFAAVKASTSSAGNDFFDSVVTNEDAVI